jgi:hypothetical protein
VVAHAPQITSLEAEAPELDDVLEAIDGFQLASIGLVAWDLCVGEDAVVPAWREAMQHRLIERVGRCPMTREPMYMLASAPAAMVTHRARGLAP